MPPRETKPLWLVQPRLDAAHYRARLIGSVVKYPDAPLERHVPSRPGAPLPSQIAPLLDPPPVRVADVRVWTRRARDAAVRAGVDELVRGWADAGRAEGSAAERRAAVARVWHMDSPGDRFRELLRHGGYFEEVFEMLRGDGRGYFVTDVVTLVNMRVAEAHERARDAGAGVAAAVGAAAAVTLNGGLGIGVGVGSGEDGKGGGTRVGARRRSVRERLVEGSYEEETIVFLGYRLVRLEKVRGVRARLGRLLRGRKHGFAVRDGFDYWPEMVERAVEGNAEPFLAVETPRVAQAGGADGGDDEGVEDDGGEEEWEDMVRVLGCDFEVVG